MGLTYKNLWKFLIDHDLKKSDLRSITNLSASTISKLAKNENVNTEVLARICLALDCDICDIVKFENDDCSKESKA